MRKRDWTNIMGGALLVAAGLSIGLYAMQQYNMGTASRMDAGYFPTVLGFLLAFLGLLVLLPALCRPGELPVAHLRPFFATLVALLAFAFSVRSLGMVPATFILVGLAATAQKEVRFVLTLVIAAGLSVLAVLVFGKGLGVSLPAFHWPF